MNFLVSQTFSPFCFLFHIQKTRNERALSRAHLSFSATNFQRMPNKTQMYVVRHEVMFFFLQFFYLFVYPFLLRKFWSVFY